MLTLRALLGYIFAGWCGGLLVAYATLAPAGGHWTLFTLYVTTAALTAAGMIVALIRDVRRRHVLPDPWPWQR